MSDIRAPIVRIENLPSDEAFRRLKIVSSKSFEAVTAIAVDTPTTLVSGMMSMVSCLFSNLRKFDKEACDQYFMAVIRIDDQTLPESERKIADASFNDAHQRLCAAYDLYIANTEGKA